MKNIEIEIKVQIERVDILKDFLINNAEKISEERQIDEYFTPAHRDFLSIKPVEEWLRLRNTDGECSIAYKKWHYDESGKSNHCDEHETQVANSKQLGMIFNALDYKSIVKVDKNRTTYRYKDYEISLDQVKKLGDFVEIEYKGKGNTIDPKKITDQMISFLNGLEVGRITRNYVGYPFQLLFPSN